MKRGDTDAKKNSLSRMIGPPIEPPISLRLLSCFSSCTFNTVVSSIGLSCSRCTGLAEMVLPEK
jgi:hypothetical protein